jgi:hypothetical protein
MYRTRVPETVFVLGAGFSAALSPEMPIMSVLSRLIREELRRHNQSVPAVVDVFGDDLERWLSYLADAQPWLSQATILHNQASYLDVALATEKVISERQNAAVRDAEPPWLPALLAFWQRFESPVITFNYDVLVEAAAVEHGGGRGWMDYYRAPLTPAAHRIGAVLGGSRPTGFSLLKPHGSVTWFWSGPGSVAGDPIYDVGLKGGWSLDGLASPYEETMDILVVDKEPMIVPPTATKSRFYDNAVLRSQWLQAADALGQASELVLIGYSLPASDLVVRALLATTFQGDVVVPVNRSTDVVARLRDLFGDRVIDQFTGSDSAVSDFVTSRCA